MERDPASMENVAHRPWPLPAAPWVLYQSWRDLLFMHWRVPSDRIEPLVPPPLHVDRFDGDVWVTLAPFLIQDNRLRGLPPVPGFSEFPELNLRTYVTLENRPGVFFFSLDAGSALAVAGARLFFRLPYYRAVMSVRTEEEWVHYESRRANGAAHLDIDYRPAGESSCPAEGSIEHFLTERYALYAVLRNGRALRGDIHHAPWRLQPAEAFIVHNTVAAAAGIALPDTPPLLHFSRRQDTRIWAPILV